MSNLETQLSAVRELAEKRDIRIVELESHCARQNKQIAELKRQLKEEP